MFRLVQQKGILSSNPVILQLYASGIIQIGEAVDMDRSRGLIIPASANSTYTTIFGISLDTVRGVSDTVCRVIPFTSGQVWAGDVANVSTTGMILIKHKLSDRATISNTSYDQTVATGIFLAYGFNKSLMIGEFIRVPVGWNTDTVGYF